MTPKRVDVHILCAKCQKPVDVRVLEHAPDDGKYHYRVSCHGEQQELRLDIDGAHGKVLSAFNPEKPNG